MLSLNSSDLCQLKKAKGPTLLCGSIGLSLASDHRCISLRMKVFTFDPFWRSRSSPITALSATMDHASLITTSFIIAASAGQASLGPGLDRTQPIDYLLRENQRMQTPSSPHDSCDAHHISALRHHYQGFQLFKQRESRTLRQILTLTPKKAKGWRRHLATALREAELAMRTVRTVEKELDCFYIICSASFALDENDRRVTLRQILFWIHQLMQERSIQFAMEQLSLCLQDPAENALTKPQVQLLSRFFTYISSAVLCSAMYGNHFFGREQHGDWIPGEESYQSEREEMRNLFQDSEVLCTATNPKNLFHWYELQCRDGDATQRVEWDTIPISPPALEMLHRQTMGNLSPHNSDLSDCETVLSTDDSESVFDQPRRGDVIEIPYLLMDLCQCESIERYIPGNVKVRRDYQKPLGSIHNVSKETMSTTSSLKTSSSLSSHLNTFGHET